MDKKMDSTENLSAGINEEKLQNEVDSVMQMPIYSENDSKCKWSVCLYSGVAVLLSLCVLLCGAGLWGIYHGFLIWSADKRNAEQQLQFLINAGKAEQVRQEKSSKAELARQEKLFASLKKTHEEELLRLAEHKKRAEENLVALKAEALNIRKKITEQEVLLKSKDGEIKKIETLKQELATLQKQFVELQRQAVNQEESAALQAKRKQEIEKEILTQQIALKTLSQQIAEGKKSLAETQFTSNSLAIVKQQLEKSQKTLEQLQKDLLLLTDKKLKAVEETNQFISKSSAVKNELRTWEQKLTAVKLQNESLLQQKKSLESDIGTYKSNVTTLLSTQKMLNREIPIQQTTLGKLKQEISAFEKQKQDLVQELKQLNSKKESNQFIIIPSK